MGILDRLRGGGANRQQEASPSTSGREADHLGAEEVLQTAEAPDIYGGIPDVSNLPPGSALGSLPSSPGSTQRLYNPYEGLESALDRRMSKGTYALPDQPEFLFDEEATVHRRNWSENITYYTGTGYLGGALVGGSQGFLQAVQSKPEAGLPDTARLRVNRFLNMTGRSGRLAGNSLGALGLFFAGFESFGLSYWSDGRVSDSLNSIAAASATGALFRATRGPRAAAIAGLVGAAAGATLVGARQTLVRGL